MAHSNNFGIPRRPNKNDYFRLQMVNHASIGSNNKNDRWTSYSLNGEPGITWATSSIAGCPVNFGPFTIVDSLTTGFGLQINMDGWISVTYTSTNNAGGGNLGLALSTPNAPTTTGTAIESQGQLNTLACASGTSNTVSVNYSGWVRAGETILPNSDAAIGTNGNTNTFWASFLLI